MVMQLHRDGTGHVIRDKRTDDCKHHRDGYMVRAGDGCWEVVRVRYATSGEKFVVEAFCPTEQLADSLAFALARELANAVQ